MPLYYVSMSDIDDSKGNPKDNNEYDEYEEFFEEIDKVIGEAWNMIWAQLLTTYMKLGNVRRESETTKAIQRRHERLRAFWKKCFSTSIWCIKISKKRILELLKQ